MGYFDDTMTVGELVKLLLKQDQGAKVITEGCDCMGEVRSVAVEYGDMVCINRTIREES